MAAYRAGDPVHVAGFGKGIVREARNNGRYLVELKGRAMEVAAADLTALEATRTRPRSRGPGRGGSSAFARSASADRRSLGGGWSGRPKSTERSENPAGESDTPNAIVTIDLHGHTVDEALDLLERALNDALLAGARELRVIHGKSGGRIKAAVHRRLGQLPPVQAFRVDSQNPGVTLVVL